MRYVVQQRFLWLFWLDVEGHDWIGWRDSIEAADELMHELAAADAIDRRRAEVVREGGQ
jgi:hypothetical protein